MGCGLCVIAVRNAAEITRFLLRYAGARVGSAGGVGSGGGVDVEIYGDAPLLKEPFGDVDTIPILLAPGPELARRGIRSRRELQVPDPPFEFSGVSGSVQNGMAPIWVPAFALRNWKSNWSHHSLMILRFWSDEWKAFLRPKMMTCLWRKWKSLHV